MPRHVPERYRVDEAPTRHQERAFSVVVDHVAGMEIRPTRVFFWIGARVPGSELLMSLDLPPKLLRSARRRHVDLGPFHLSFLGNPIVTLGLFAVRSVRRLLHLRRGQAPAA